MTVIRFKKRELLEFGLSKCACLFGAKVLMLLTLEGIPYLHMHRNVNTD